MAQSEKMAIIPRSGSPCRPPRGEAHWERLFMYPGWFVLLGRASTARRWCHDGMDNCGRHDVGPGRVSLTASRDFLDRSLGRRGGAT